MNEEPVTHPAKASLQLAVISFFLIFLGIILTVPTDGAMAILIVVGFIGSLVGFGAAFMPLRNHTISRRERFRAMGIGMLANLPMITLGIALPFIVSHVISDAYRSYPKSNGKNLYTMAYAGAVGEHPDSFPSSALDANATAYCQRLHRDGLLVATPDFVSGFRQQSATSWNTLAPENVGWCFVADLRVDSTAGTPFAFSSNLSATNTSQLVGKLGDLLDPTHPNGNKHLIVVFHGGGVQMCRACETWESILPEGLTNTTYRILQP